MLVEKRWFVTGASLHELHLGSKRLMTHTIRVPFPPRNDTRRNGPSLRRNQMLLKAAGRLAFVALALGAARPADAQYFGRNKVQYERFDWRILKSDHFDLYF